MSAGESTAELEAAVRAGTEELLKRVGEAFAAAPEGWANGLRAVAWEMLRFLREDERRARLMVIEVLDGSPEAMAVREQGMAALAALIDLGRQNLADPESVSPTAAEITAGVIYNRIHVGVEKGVDTLDGEMVRELMFTAVMPYLGIEAALAELHAPEPPDRG